MEESFSVSVHRYLEMDRASAAQRCLARGRNPWDVIKFFELFDDEDAWVELKMHITFFDSEISQGWTPYFVKRVIFLGAIFEGTDPSEAREAVYGGSHPPPRQAYYEDDRKWRQSTPMAIQADLFLTDVTRAGDGVEVTVHVPKRWVANLSEGASWAGEPTGAIDGHLTEELGAERKKGGALTYWTQISTAFLPSPPAEAAERVDFDVVDVPHPLVRGVRGLFCDTDTPSVVAPGGLHIEAPGVALGTALQGVVRCDAAEARAEEVVRIEKPYAPPLDAVRVDDAVWATTGKVKGGAWDKGMLVCRDGQVEDVLTNKGVGGGRIFPRYLRQVDDGRILTWGDRAAIYEDGQWRGLHKQFSDKGIETMVMTPDGAIWSLGTASLRRAAPDQEGEAPVVVEGDVPRYTRAVVPHPSGSVWLLSSHPDGFVYRVDPHGTVELLEGLQDWLNAPLLGGFFVDEQRGWFLTNLGQLVYLQDGEPPRLFNWKGPEAELISRCADQFVESIHRFWYKNLDRLPVMPDPAGGLWFGYAGGVFYISAQDLDEMLDSQRVNPAALAELALRPIEFGVGGS